MTWAQWVFEYQTLQRQEATRIEQQAETLKACFEGAKNMLINMLGLNLVPGAPKPKEGEDALTLPLWWFIGHPRVTAVLMEQLQSDAATESATNDEKFEVLSDQLNQALKTGTSALPDRLVEMLTQDLGNIDKNPVWSSQRTQATLAAMVEPRPKSAPPVPHIDAVPKVTVARREELNRTAAAAEAERTGREVVEIPEEEIEKYLEALKE
jgi:hypothetical protein